MKGWTATVKRLKKLRKNAAANAFIFTENSRHFVGIVLLPSLTSFSSIIAICNTALPDIYSFFYECFPVPDIEMNKFLHEYKSTIYEAFFNKSICTSQSE